MASGHPASGGRDWIARMLNPVPLAAGQRIGVSFDLAKAHLFAKDGRAIPPTEA